MSIEKHTVTTEASRHHAQLAQALLYQSVQEVLLLQKLAENSGIVVKSVSDAESFDLAWQEIRGIVISTRDIKETRTIILTDPVIATYIRQKENTLPIVAKYEMQLRNKIYVVSLDQSNVEFHLLPRITVTAVYDCSSYFQTVSAQSTGIVDLAKSLSQPGNLD